MTMRIVQVLALCLACATSSSVLACTCGGTTLEGYFGSRANVFTAIVTSARIEPDGNVVVGFAVIENFKGDIPFRQLMTEEYGTGCDVSIWVGAEYLFFLDDDGYFRSCSGSRILISGEDQPWVRILEAYKAGKTPDLSSPWSLYEIDGICTLHTDFLATEQRFASSITISYRYALPETPIPDEPELNRLGHASVVLWLPTREETHDASVFMETANRKFQAIWREPRGRSYGGGAFVLEDDDAIAFAEALPGTAGVTLRGAISRYGSIDGAEIRTTHAGTAISEFNACLKKAL